MAESMQVMQHEIDLLKFRNSDLVQKISELQQLALQKIASNPGSDPAAQPGSPKPEEADPAEELKSTRTAKDKSVPASKKQQSNAYENSKSRVSATPDKRMIKGSKVERNPETQVQKPADSTITSAKATHEAHMQLAPFTVNTPASSKMLLPREGAVGEKTARQQTQYIQGISVSSAAGKEAASEERLKQAQQSLKVLEKKFETVKTVLHAFGLSGNEKDLPALFALKMQEILLNPSVFKLSALRKKPVDKYRLAELEEDAADGDPTSTSL